MDLLERDLLLEQLDALLAAAGARGGVALVAGEAGVGKTTLVEHFLGRQGEAVRVLVGRCDPLVTPRALGPLHDLAHAAGGSLAASVTDGAPRERLFEALLGDLRTPARPQVVVVEDAHWADEATMDLLVFLGRRIAETSALLVVTYRDDELEIDHPLRGVLAALGRAGAHRLAVGPLSEAAVDALARGAGRDATGLHALTGGNALLVSEVLATDGDDVPPTVSDLVLSRYATLPAEARSVVRLVAVVPTRAELWLVEGALQASVAGVHGAVAAAVARGLLVTTGDAVTFRHELLRRAVESSLDELDRRDLNRRVLAVLVADDERVDIARLVHHARAAGDVEATLRYAPDAAERAAAVSAHREAVGHYRAVLAHRDRLAPDARAGLLHRYSTECYLSGLSTEAVAAGQAAVQLLEELGDQERLGAGLRWLSRLHWWDGNRPEAEAAVGRAIGTLEAIGAGHELGMAYSSQSQLDMLANHSAPAIGWAERALEIADRLGDAEIRTHALTNIGSARLLAGEPTGRADLERAFEIAEGAGLDDDAARALSNLATCSSDTRDYGNALRDLDRALEYVEARELSGYVQHLLGHRARVRLDQGDWAGAERDATLALAQTVSGGVRVVDGLVPLGLLQARRGEEDAAATLHEAAARTPEGADLQWAGPVAAARAEHAWLTGDDAAAVAAATPVLARAVEGAQPWWAGELVLWMWLAGADVGDASAVAPPYRLLVSGEWRAAAAAWEELGCRYHRALALAQGPEGDSAVTEARSLLHARGARHTAARLRRDLRRRGHRRLPRGPNRASAVNSSGLTTRQLDVLALVMRGLTDAEIGDRLSLSSKTVGHHVSAVLAKLRVPSRHEAAEAARRLGISPADVARRDGEPSG